MEKLYRSSSDMYIGGVCGGLAENIKIDSNIIRIIFVLFAVFGAGVVIYLIMWAILPLKASEDYEKDKTDRKDGDTINMKKGEDNTYKITDTKNLRFFGCILIFLGVLLLLNNLFLSLDFHKLWPLLIIFIGTIIIFSRKEK